MTIFGRGHQNEHRILHHNLDLDPDPAVDPAAWEETQQQHVLIQTIFQICYNVAELVFLMCLTIYVHLVVEVYRDLVED